MNRPERTFATREIRVERRLPSYWRVTFDLPPVNIFGPKETLQLGEIITAIERDEQVKVVVFDSAVDGFFLTHYDFLAPLEESAKIPPGPTGLAGVAGYAGSPQPGSGRVHCLNSGARNRDRKRACFGKAICGSRASRRPFCPNGKLARGWCQAEEQWPDCHG
jgi:hypothetical protein